MWKLCVQFLGSVLMGREGPSPVPPFLLPDSRNADRRAGVGTATFLGRAKHPVRQIMLPHFTNEETAPRVNDWTQKQTEN